MAIFGMGKKEVNQQQPQQPQVSALDEVVRLRQQGASNAKVIESLQRSGYKTHQIFDALNQAEIGRSGEKISGAPFFNEGQQPQQMPNLPPEEPAFEEQAPQDAEQGYDEKIEEMAEAIIEEKWNDLLKDINKIVEWKNTMESNMKALEQRQTELKQSFDNLQKAVLSKISDYDQNITNVGTELKALEKVFQKILPTFTENVNELSRTVKELKKSK
ncbi:hypothetical protein HYU11_03330 [Candidatus Woesearchaeota archaeon]|nr:hypothetical protein [Candidatus Woesearchaeota archaeon]